MRRPNIVFLLTDNQRADLVGCAGNHIIETPNLDLLGYRGVRFANAFATTPVCAASRASYLTGLYERRHRFTFNTPPLRKHTRFDNADNRQRHLKGLYRMISGVDRNVGRIAAALERHSLARDTVLIFASDHGMYYGERGLSDCWQLNEQPLRVPLIVCDPGRDPGGWRRTELALNIDVAPTHHPGSGRRAGPGPHAGAQPGAAVRGRPRARLAHRVLLRTPVRALRHPQERRLPHRAHQVPALLRANPGVRGTLTDTQLKSGG